MSSDYLLKVHKALAASHGAVVNVDCQECKVSSHVTFLSEDGFVLENNAPEFQWCTQNTREYVSALKSKARDAVRDHLEKLVVDE